MTNASFKSGWDKVLELLYTRIEPIKVDNFVKPLVPAKLSEKEEKIYLRSTVGQTSFFQSRANSIKRDLDDCILEVFGKPYAVEIVEKEPPEELIPADPSVPVDELFLKPEFTFENFVAGSENQFPLAACLAVADGYSKAYNPLFLYGESGVGKTHLMHAIGNYVSKNSPKKKVLYVSAETFTTELVNAIQRKTQSQFKNRFRNIDYLLFDDVQFIAGKSASIEEELFNTFETLHAKGKQVVFTSDKAPEELGNFPDRLKSRFSMGMTAQLKQPGYESKLAILKNKAILGDLDITDKDLLDALDLIASTNKDNVRELEGYYNRVVAHAAFTNRKISPELVKEVLSEAFKEQKKELSPEMIKKAVAAYYGIKVSELESKKRQRNIAYPRQIAIYLIREKTSYSFPQIGAFFGGRDHSTIMHSYEKICEEMQFSKEIKGALENIERVLEK